MHPKQLVHYWKELIKDMHAITIKNIIAKGRIFRSPLNHIETPTENYLFNACAYIHANPVQAGLVGFSEEWEFSNFQEYIRMRKGTLYSEQFLIDYIVNRKNTD